MATSLARVQADLEAGRVWKARDRLNGMLRDRQDAEVLGLLVTVHLEMRDLPAAGALCFVLGRTDPQALGAIAAWRERYGDDEARWRSIPSPVRDAGRSQQLCDLERAARDVVPGRRFAHSGRTVFVESFWDKCLTVGCAVLVICVLATLLIGAWTVARWVFF